MTTGHEMSNSIHEWIEENIPKGSTILELGSGKGTLRMVKNYTVYSVEHNDKWMNRYGSNYIYAPIKNGWYDVEAIKKGIPEHYDLLIIDGPVWKKSKDIGRKHLVSHLDLFDTNCCMIFDDYHRNDVPDLVRNISNIIGRDYTIFDGMSGHRRIKFSIFYKADNG